MGQLTPGSADLAIDIVSGIFAGAGQSASRHCFGSFNAVLQGVWVGSIQLERSFHGGSTWVLCGVGGGGQEAVYTAPPISVVATEPEVGVLYRWNCTLLTSGTVNYRLSGGGLDPGWFYNAAGVLVRKAF